MLLTFLTSKVPPKITHIQPGEYCIDGFIEKRMGENASSNDTVVSYSGSEWNQIVIACSPEKPQIHVCLNTKLYKFFGRGDDVLEIFKITKSVSIPLN
jgi:hypothetical protein